MMTNQKGYIEYFICKKEKKKTIQTVYTSVASTKFVSLPPSSSSATLNKLFTRSDEPY